MYLYPYFFFLRKSDSSAGTHQSSKVSMFSMFIFLFCMAMHSRCLITNDSVHRISRNKT